MKINWGTKLAFFAIMFMIFVVTMVVIISKQEVALVDDNYYEKGLNYQKEIDNSNQMDSSITIEIGRSNDDKVLLVNKGSSGDFLEATIKYYRPSNPELDQQFKTQILSGKQMMHPLKDLEPGLWRVALIWKEGEKEFKLEKDFER